MNKVLFCFIIIGIVIILMMMMTFKDQFLLPYTCNIRVLFLNKVFLLSLKNFFYNNNNNYISNNNNSNNNNNNNNNNNGFIQHFHKVALHLLCA